MSSDLQQLLERDHRQIDDGFAPVARGAELTEQVRADYARAADDLRRHIYAEEELLFPPLRAAGMFGPVMVMLREHAEIWQTLDQLDAALTDPTADTAGLGTELLGRLATHNVKEEAILYPEADATVPTADAGRITAVVGGEAIPQDWAPEMLRR